MKFTLQTPVDYEVTHVRVVLPVRYEEEDIPNDFPLREGDVWTATIELSTGKISEWPQGVAGSIGNMKDRKSVV